MDHIFEYLGFALGLVSFVLHFIAPKTKNTVDDKAAEVVDAVKDALPADPAPSVSQSQK